MGKCSLFCQKRIYCAVCWPFCPKCARYPYREGQFNHRLQLAGQNHRPHYGRVDGIFRFLYRHLYSREHPPGGGRTHPAAPVHHANFPCHHPEGQVPGSLYDRTGAGCHAAHCCPVNFWHPVGRFIAHGAYGPGNYIQRLVMRHFCQFLT